QAQSQQVPPTVATTTAEGGHPGGGRHGGGYGSSDTAGGPMAGAARQWDRTAGGGGPKRRPGQTVYTVPSAQSETDPKPVEIRTGITGGRFTQVAAGELKPGDTVVVGLVTAKAEAITPGRPPGMGGPGGGGGRRF